ncbi:MAG: FkbM family methyltransferase [Pseudomonadota bacterium]
MSAPPFGALAPSAREARYRALAHRLPANYWGRRAASLLLGPAGGRTGAPKDVAVFGTQRARLHPYDNICEKRVYATPQLWEPRERAALAAHITAAPGTDYVFVDVGANVGLYTLFARSAAAAAGKRLRAVCIEADPDMRARLAFNLAASKARDEACVLPFAVSRRREALRFAVNPRSRGTSRLSADGALDVQGEPLAAMLLVHTAVRRVDAMKIDVEGGEFEALDGFFAAAPQSLFPDLIIMEVAHDDGRALQRCKAAGYAVRSRVRGNVVLQREASMPESSGRSVD